MKIRPASEKQENEVDKERDWTGLDIALALGFI